MFGGGGGGFGTSGAGFGAATPFGSTTAQQGSTFGGGTAFGASTTSAFGAKPAFGSTNTGGFGTTPTAFGAKPSVFGAPAPAPATTFGAPAAGTSAFGRTTSTSPFGTTPAPAAGGAFGLTTSAFGATAPPASPFGAPAPATGLGGAFGSTTASNPFGKPASSLFGAPAPAPAVGGVFGAPAPAPATGGFGGFTTATTTTGLFGSTPTLAATGAFRAPAAAPAGGLFGAAPAAGLGGFGAGASPFGTPVQQQQGTGKPPWRETRAEDPTVKAGANPGMLMSISAMKDYEGKSHEELRLEDYLQGRKNSSAISAAASTGFGATPAPAAAGLFPGFVAAPVPAPAAGSFNFGGTPTATALAPAPFSAFRTTAAPVPATSIFGAPAATSAFGAPASAPVGGFNFPAPGPAPATNVFGSLFGGTPAPAPAPVGAFGPPAPAPAASGFAGLFSSTTTTPAPTTTAGGFGTNPTVAPTASPFSFGPTAPVATGIFGASTTPAPSAFSGATGLFGSTPTAAAPAATTGVFGFGSESAASPAPAGGFAFGGADGASGSASKVATGPFGAPALAAGALFGSTAPALTASGFGYGGTPVPAPAAIGGFTGLGSAFGASATNHFGVVPPTPSTTSMFGAPALGGRFGAPAVAPATGGFFGATSQQPQQQQQQQRVAIHNQDPYGSVSNAGYGSGALEQKIKGVENSSSQLAISFERNNADSSGISASDQNGGIGQASPSLGFAYRRTPRSNAFIQPRGFGGGGLASSKKNGGHVDKNRGTIAPPSSSRLLSEGALTPGGKSGVLSPDVYLSGSVKRLNIPPDTEERRQRFSAARPLIKPSPALLRGSNGGVGTRRSLASDVVSDDHFESVRSGDGVKETKSGDPVGTPRTSTSSYNPPASSTNGNRAGGIMSPPEGSSARFHTNGGGLASPPPSSSGVGTDVRAAAGGADGSLLDASPAGSSGRLFTEGHGDDPSVAPKLGVKGYETRPPMSALEAMSKNELQSVSGFVVSRPGFGSIAWKEPVDLRGLDIGKLVAIERKSVSVYDDLPDGEVKPVVGEGLNKATRVTLYGVFPKGDDPSEEEERRYEGRVRKNTIKIGAKLVEYDVDTGKWIFDTFHWSRYAMDDSDDEDDTNGGKNGKQEGAAVKNGKTASAKKMPPPPPLGPAGRVHRTHGQTLASRDQEQSGPMPQHRVKYSMPDTDDEGSVTDSASDAGKGAPATASAHGSVKGMKAGSDGQVAGIAVDLDGSASDCDADFQDDENLWVNPQGDATSNNLFPERVPSQAEHMRSSLFEQEEKRDVTRDSSRDLSIGGIGVGEARSSSIRQSSTWLPLPPPLLPPRPVLGNWEDAEAAANFRPVVPGSQSRVLRLLANAWEPVQGEVKAEGPRGSVRAGRTVADLGLRMGRAFRASWGAGGVLACPRTFRSEGSLGGHSVSVVQFDPMPAASGRDVGALFVSPLRNHFQFAEPVQEEKRRSAASAAPPRWALPTRKTDDPDKYAALVQCMHGYVAVHEAAGTASFRDKSVKDSPEWVLEQAWRLTSAIWGQEEGEGRAQDLPIPGEIRPDSVGDAWEFDGASPASRREASVSAWLTNAVASCVLANKPSLGHGEVHSSGSGKNAGQYIWRRVLELLSVHRVEEAAKAAMAAGLPRLAVVLTSAASQAVGQTTGRYASKFLAQQAALWQGGGADARMPQEAFSVYQLLGREGFRDVRLRGVIGKGSDSAHPSLDWLRQLGLCLWFGAGAPAGSGNGNGGTIAEAMEAYESLVAEEEALPPTSRYFLEPTHHDEEDLDQVCEELRRVHVGQGHKSGSRMSCGRDRCVLSRLLAMYPPSSPVAGGGASGVALLAALEPMAVTPDVMDYRHSWHLLSVVEALGVAKVPDRAKAAAVAEGLRFQLVSAGLWEWAVYVTLTAEGDPDRRESTARELVLRHGYGLLGAPFKSADEARYDLLKDIGVPTAWLHEAAAVYAGYQHRSALKTSTPLLACRLDAPLVPERAQAEFNRETKLDLLVSAQSKELISEASREACALAPINMYLGGSSLNRLTTHFGNISRQIESAKRQISLLGGCNGNGNTSCHMGAGRCSFDGGKDFDAYKEILEAAKEGPAAGILAGWSKEEVERLERLRCVVQHTAARVVGPAIAHESFDTVWKMTGIPIA